MAIWSVSADSLSAVLVLICVWVVTNMPVQNQIQLSIDERGFSLLEGLDPGLTTLAVASQIGRVLHLEGFETVQVLQPKARAQALKNSYSGNFGLQAFPMHTDLAHWPVPPRYLMLRCVCGASAVPTRLLDGAIPVSAIGELDLRRTLVHPRRPLAGKLPLMRLLEYHTNQFLRWDSLFIVAATPTSAVTFSKMLKFLGTVEGEPITLAKPGDTLIIDNWRMLHGRAPIPPDCRDRKIERIYLESLA